MIGTLRSEITAKLPKIDNAKQNIRLIRENKEGSMPPDPTPSDFTIAPTKCPATPVRILALAEGKPAHPDPMITVTAS